MFAPVTLSSTVTAVNAGSSSIAAVNSSYNAVISTIGGAVITPSTGVRGDGGSSSSSGVGGIVAGVLVAIVLFAVIICLIIFLLWYRAKRRKQYKIAGEPKPTAALH